jgi:molecular chaperone GrpE (heat shock protein)
MKKRDIKNFDIIQLINYISYLESEYDYLEEDYLNSVDELKNLKKRYNKLGEDYNDVCEEFVEDYIDDIYDVNLNNMSLSDEFKLKLLFQAYKKYDLEELERIFK